MCEECIVLLGNDDSPKSTAFTFSGAVPCVEHEAKAAQPVSTHALS
jgi:hypothetical protein